MMKKIIVFLCLILFSMFNSICFCAEKLTDDGYGLITTSVSKYPEVMNNPKDIVRYLSGMESEFSGFINKNNNKNQNSKLFGIYMQNMYVLRNRFFEYVSNSDDLQKYSISVESDEDVDTHYHFTYPYVDNVKLKIYDGFEFAFDYKRMQDKYSSHLNKTWNTYLKYCIEQENDYLERLTHDSEDDYYDIYMQECNKWMKKWTIFLTFHPNFPLAEQIKEEIKSFEQAAQKEFNVGIYFLYIALACLAVLALITAMVKIILKFSLINKFNSFSKNIVQKTFEQMIKFKIIIFIIIGIIILICTAILIHNSFSLPKCDSKYAEEAVISIFRQNDKIYQPNMDNVETITMSNFKPISYDKGINKYSCSANLTMYSKSDRAIFFVVPYNSFTYNVEYDIYKERGENKVSASWTMQNIWTQDIRR